jgi:DNA-binding transcriptional regulator YbjK
MPIDCTDTNRHARIEQMIEKYRLAKRRQLLQRAIRLWRRAQAHHNVAELDVPPERVH